VTVLHGVPGATKTCRVIDFVWSAEVVIPASFTL
jgi:steroid 5-alpha reductase family enzyme